MDIFGASMDKKMNLLIALNHTFAAVILNVQQSAPLALIETQVS